MELFVNVGREIDIAAVDARDCGLWIIDGFQGHLDALLHFGEMEDAGVGASLLHVFGNGHDAVVGAEGDDVISAADLLIQMREKVAEILVQPY